MVDAKDQDMGELGMQCVTHPYTKNPGGICALCLQEKLGKLVTSSSFPLPKPTHLSPSPSASSSSTTSLALSLSSAKDSTNNLPFLLAKKKKDMLASSSSSSSSTSSSASANLIYKRSKSTAAGYGESYSQRKRSGFWSFLHLYSSKHQIRNSSTKKVNNFSHSRSQTTETTSKRSIDVIVEEEDEKSPSDNKEVTETPTNGGGGGGGGSSFGRKVLRSRSVGCGSRSFSGDFFERISNGFGDCALRRIESQRESSKVITNGEAMNDMVKCGGIFGGFMIMTSSSSSSSTTSSTVDHHHHKMGNNNNNKSWGWAFASPMRGAKTSSTHHNRDRTIITESSTTTNTSQNLDSIPSLVALRS